MNDPKYKNIGKTAHLGIGFFVLQIAFGSASTIQSKIMNDDGFGKLGFYTMSTVYISCGLSCLFATSFIQRLGNKVSLAIASALNALWVFSSILAAIKYENPDYKSFIVTDAFVYPLLIFLSILSGVGNSLLWVAGGNYIAECATEEAKGIYFGLFCFIYTLNLIFGYLIAAYVLGRMD